MAWSSRAAAAALLSFVFAASWAGAPAGAPQQAAPQFPVDPQTGRAIGAKEMVPEALRALVDRKAPVMIIDVRDEAQFAKETIKGAVHVPLAELEARLEDIPKDTVLVFT
jgi:hypothetical protein